MYNFESEGDTSEEASDSIDVSWIESFCAERGHEWFCEISISYLQEPSNLVGIQLSKGNVERALSGILDMELSEDGNDPDNEELIASMEELYSLLHAKYICTKEGLAQMV